MEERRDAQGRFLPGAMPPGSKPFEPGHPAYPAGPNARRLTSILLKRLEENDGKLSKALIDVILKNALQGKYPFVQELLQRVEGKVADRLVAEGGLTINIRDKFRDDDAGSDTDHTGGSGDGGSDGKGH